MTDDSSGSHPVAVAPDTCPMCHTLRPAVDSAGGGSDAWRCPRCGQQWDADRVLAVGAYAVWSREHDRARSGAEKPSSLGSAAAAQGMP